MVGLKVRWEYFLGRLIKILLKVSLLILGNIFNVNIFKVIRR